MFAFFDIFLLWLREELPRSLCWSMRSTVGAHTQKPEHKQNNRPGLMLGFFDIFFSLGLRGELVFSSFEIFLHFGSGRGSSTSVWLREPLLEPKCKNISKELNTSSPLTPKLKKISKNPNISPGLLFCLCSGFWVCAPTVDLMLQQELLGSYSLSHSRKI